MTSHCILVKQREIRSSLCLFATTGEAQPSTDSTLNDFILFCAAVLIHLSELLCDAYCVRPLYATCSYEFLPSFSPFSRAFYFSHAFRFARTEREREKRNAVSKPCGSTPTTNWNVGIPMDDVVAAAAAHSHNRDYNRGKQTSWADGSSLKC